MRGLFAFAIACVVAGCVRPDSVQCADGSVCPRDRTCWLVDDAYQCVSDEQIAACEGKPDLVACAGGTCFGGACLTPSCGDLRIGPIEVCDDGNTAPGDGCSSDCRSDETCGNGTIDVQVGEECDDGQPFGGLSHDGCSSACREERPIWRLLPDYDAVFDGSVGWNAVYDSSRGRVFALGESRSSMHTRELDAGVWTDVTPLVSPPVRDAVALAYDSKRKRVVMFGGLGFRDTWEWDGATWSLRQPLVTPPARAAHTMTYDPIGERVVIFGGRTSLGGTSTEIADTWAWDGTNWTEIVGPAPPARSDAAMAFDPVRGVIVLYGGAFPPDITMSDTWELSGTTWTERTSAVTPGPRHHHAMAFDPKSRRMLVYGGMDGPVLDTTYAWDGTNWAFLANDVVDLGGSRMVTLVDEERVLRFNTLGTYEWNGSGWTRQMLATQGGVRRSNVAAAVDVAGRRLLVFGGLDRGALSAQTDMWRGAWARIQGPGPSARAYSAIAYDEQRGEFVLFGGSDNNTELGDTWIFGASGWSRRFPQTSPPVRGGHSMVFDVRRGVVMLFGGFANGGQRADTWTWDGATWTEITSAGPSARSDHAATYDPIREEVVVFGGYAGPGAPAVGDTWTWNGAWTKKSDIGPTPRFSTGIAWDASRRHVMLYGGNNGAGDFSDVWEWDGNTWTQVAASALGARSSHAVVSSLDGAGVLRFGIGGNSFDRDEVAQLRWATESPEEACIVGGDFDGDGFRELACGGGDPDCWRTCSPRCPPGTSCPAGSVGCGDGTCTIERENCLTCPGDCGACPVTCGDLACDAGETPATCAADCP